MHLGNVMIESHLVDPKKGDIILVRLAFRLKFGFRVHTRTALRRLDVRLAIGAPGPSRTGTALRQPDFESGASTSSATGTRAPDISGAPPGATRFFRLILVRKQP